MLPRTLWFTGLPASGKSTLARAVEKALATGEMPCAVLDGDELRRGLSSDLGYSRADRSENLRRAAEVCRLLNAAGVTAIVALISPYLADREAARRIVGDSAFVETYLSTSLAVCEARDPKGLYARARSGLISEFTGISDPYEPPLNPDIVLDTAVLTVEQCVEQIVALFAR